jgi:hypothetical protein
LYCNAASVAELWDEDPEGFAFEEGGDSWRYSWRPCCETVFLSLFHEFRELLAPLLVQMVRSVTCCETVFLSLFHEFRELLAPLLVQMVRSVTLMLALIFGPGLVPGSTSTGQYRTGIV